MLILRFGFLCLVVLFTNSVNAKEYRVNSTSALSLSISSSLPGDTITILNGTYNDWRIAFYATGTSSANILLRAETVGGVILAGNSSLAIGGQYLVVSGLKFSNGYISKGSVIEFRKSPSSKSSYCRLTNTSIIDYNPPDSLTGNKWISLYGYHNRVDHCYLKGKRNLGTTLVVWLDSTANYHQIDSNYFGHRPRLGINGGETIRVGTSGWSMFDSFTTVEYNLFEECDGEIEIISNKSCGNVYRYNSFVSCQGTLTLRHGNRCSVYGNYFFGNHKKDSGGIRIIGEDHLVYNNYISGCTGRSLKSALTVMNGIPDSPPYGYLQVKRAVIAFNTLIDNRTSINIGPGGKKVTLPPIDCVIANNIILGKSAPLVQFTNLPINMKWQGNIFFGTEIGFASVPENNYYIDPQLSLPDVNGVIHLSSNSQAIGKSFGDYNFAAKDIDGDVRKLQRDIGCDEYSLSSPKMKPVKAQDVGPK